MIERWGKMGLVAGIGAVIAAAAAIGCASLSSANGHVDCNVVKLQSEAGRSNAEIASALGVTEADVASCHAAGPSDSGMPPETGGAETGGGAPASP